MNQPAGRRLLILLGGAAIVAATALAAFLLRPLPDEEFPLIDHVPSDAILYAGFHHFSELDPLPSPWMAELRARLSESATHLAGPVAVYLEATEASEVD